MAKIENTTVYPTVTPAASDLLIATDVSDNNKTVTFLVSSIVGGGGVLQDLQSVLDTGNTATQNINLTGNVTVIGTVAPTTITALGSTGIAGQILSSTGTGLAWINSGAKACCTWNETLTQGNTALQDVFISSAVLSVSGGGGGIAIGTPSVFSNSGVSTFTGTTNINGTSLSFNTTGQINDSTGSTGTAGQWLISQGPGLGVEWSSTTPSGAANTLQEVLSAGNTSLNTGMTFTGTSVISLGTNVTIASSGNNVWSGTNTFSSNGNTSSTAGIALTGTLWDGTSIGTAGQVLTSTGTGVLWAAAASGGGNNLQQVLNSGNVATGENANISITGALTTGTLIDSSGSPGAIGQYLSINGSGLSWVNNACCNLQDVLTVGATATTSIVLSGVGISLTAPTVIPTYIQDGGGSVGLANQVLTINAGGTALEWNTAPASGVTNISSNDGVNSTGQAITVNASAVGAVTVDVFAYAGDTNVGYVPRGGNNDPLLFLNGTGSWTAAGGGGAVTSVTLGAGAVSAGPPLIITPTVGAVVIAPQIYNGAGNTGFVPSGGTNTTFLRGDGTWEKVDGNSFGVNFRMLAQKISSGIGYFALPGASGLNTSFQSDSIKTVSVNAPSTGTWLDDELEGAVIHMNGKGGIVFCGTEDQILCSAYSTISTVTNGTYITELWKVVPCTATLPVLIGTATSVVPGPLPTPPNTGNSCVAFVLSGTTADRTVQPGEQIIATQRFNFTATFSYINNIALTLRELVIP